MIVPMLRQWFDTTSNTLVSHTNETDIKRNNYITPPPPPNDQETIGVETVWGWRGGVTEATEV